MNVEAYLKGAKRGDFQWECIESGGEGLSVDVEETELEKRYATIRRYDSKTYIAEVTLKNGYDENEFTSRNSARKWCEKLIKKDIDITN